MPWTSYPFSMSNSVLTKIQDQTYHRDDIRYSQVRAILTGDTCSIAKEESVHARWPPQRLKSRTRDESNLSLPILFGRWELQLHERGERCWYIYFGGHFGVQCEVIREEVRGSSLGAGTAGQGRDVSSQVHFNLIEAQHRLIAAHLHAQYARCGCASRRGGE